MDKDIEDLVEKFRAFLTRRAAKSQQRPAEAATEVGAGTAGAYSVDEFCNRNRISRVHLYAEWKAGRGPRRMRIGRRVLVSAEAERDWHRGLERASGSTDE